LVPESTHFRSLWELTQNDKCPCKGSPWSPLKLTLVPESTHRVGCKPAPILGFVALNLYSMYPRMFYQKNLNKRAPFFLFQKQPEQPNTVAKKSPEATHVQNSTGMEDDTVRSPPSGGSSYGHKPKLPGMRTQMPGEPEDASGEGQRRLSCFALPTLPSAGYVRESRQLPSSNTGRLGSGGSQTSFFRFVLVPVEAHLSMGYFGL